MATVNSDVMSLLDWGKLLDPDGKVARIVEMLSRRHGLVNDVMFKEGNLPTGERTTVRTGLASVYWRKMNQGTPTSKNRTRQVDEPTAMLEARSHIDEELAKLGGDLAGVRMANARGFIQAMRQEAESTMFYGSSTNPEEFVGLAERYSSLSAENARNIIDAGGTGADNTSIWLVVHGEDSYHGIFPKGLKAGLEHQDLGIDDVEDADGNIYRAYKDLWRWKVGHVVKDWRQIVRVANIDVSSLLADPGGATVKLQKNMIEAFHHIEDLSAGSAAFYMNRTVLKMLDIQAVTTANGAGPIGSTNYDGQVILDWRQIPIRTTDSLLETEARVV